MANAGEALELAMGLLRAPAHRSALRARPLPQGMDTLLAIASGSAEACRRAAQHTGYDEAELLEASRFYVQQVLLAEDADAYRVLGADRSADHATLRDHHRHLLRWLHPDRTGPGTQWDSALSSRVNQAWNLLRTPAARIQYDAANPVSSPEASPAGAATAATRAPMAAATAAISATPRYLHPNAAPLSPAGAAADGQRLSPAPILVGLLGLACIVLAWLAFTREDNFEDVRSGAIAPNRIAAASPAANGPVNDLAATAVKDPADTAANDLANELANDSANDTANKPANDPANAAIPAPPAPPAPPAFVGAAVAAIPPPAPAPPATAPLATPSTITPVTAAITPIPIAARAAPTKAAAKEAGSIVFSEAAGIAAIAAPTKAAPAGAGDPLGLFMEAEDIVRSVTDYLAADGAEPAWLDLPTGLEAAGIRTQLQARHARTAQPRMLVDSPNWTLDAMAASMLGAYRLDDRRGTVETGVLRVELIRMDQAWRVVGLQLEPAR
ncbi:J domain-containing protein [Luteimonas changyuni]|uniref:J domain-containing protein n=1 Tax=Luteimonas sp. MJ145 TaxID=3129234 RepID=UPI0031BBBA55